MRSARAIPGSPGWYRHGYSAGTVPEATLRRLTLLAAITLAAASCGDDGADTTERDAGVYASVVLALAPGVPAAGGPVPRAGEPDGVIYTGPLDDEQPIPLEVQAAVVEDLADVATVRFVDGRDEAIDERGEHQPVLEDGVLVLVGPVPAGNSPSVEAERYVDEDDTARVRVGLARRGDDWRVVEVEALEP